MTARLGSEYRYFGKLVLVPFRYFSIDTYRNIDIFDNTTSYCFAQNILPCHRTFLAHCVNEILIDLTGRMANWRMEK